MVSPVGGAAAAEGEAEDEEDLATREEDEEEESRVGRDTESALQRLAAEAAEDSKSVVAALHDIDCMPSCQFRFRLKCPFGSGWVDRRA